MSFYIQPPRKSESGQVSPDGNKQGKLDVIVVKSPKEMLSAITSAGTYLPPRIIREIKKLD